MEGNRCQHTTLLHFSAVDNILLVFILEPLFKPDFLAINQLLDAERLEMLERQRNRINFTKLADFGHRTFVKGCMGLTLLGFTYCAISATYYIAVERPQQKNQQRAEQLAGVAKREVLPE